MGGASSHETYKSSNAHKDGYRYWAKFETEPFSQGVCRYAFKGEFQGSGTMTGKLIVSPRSSRRNTPRILTCGCLTWLQARKLRYSQTISIPNNFISLTLPLKESWILSSLLLPRPINYHGSNCCGLFQCLDLRKKGWIKVRIRIKILCNNLYKRYFKAFSTSALFSCLMRNSFALSD